MTAGRFRLWVLMVLTCGSHAGEFEQDDALSRSKARGRLIACADPYSYPSSSSTAQRPGFDVEILNAIAREAALKVELYWVDTGTRGGLGRAFRNSIDKGRCEIFLGLSSGDDESLREHSLVLISPYMGMGYVLVVRGRAVEARRLADLKQQRIKVGVAMSTPMDDFLFTRGYDRALYLDSRRLLDGMKSGEVEAGMIWSTSWGQAAREQRYRDLKLVADYVPEPGLRFNAAWAVPESELPLKRFLEGALEGLQRAGEIRRIVESYSVPFYPPF